MEYNRNYGYLTDCREVPIIFPPGIGVRESLPEVGGQGCADHWRGQRHRTGGGMMRAGQPCEVSPCYVFLAPDDSGYMTGQVLCPDSGTIVSS